MNDAYTADDTDDDHDDDIDDDSDDELSGFGSGVSGSDHSRTVAPGRRHGPACCPSPGDTVVGSS